MPALDFVGAAYSLKPSGRQTSEPTMLRVLNLLSMLAGPTLTGMQRSFPTLLMVILVTRTVWETGKLCHADVYNIYLLAQALLTR